MRARGWGVASMGLTVAVGVLAAGCPQDAGDAGGGAVDAGATSAGGGGGGTGNPGASDAGADGAGAAGAGGADVAASRSDGPAVTAIEPDHITARGGAQLTITGHGFVPPVTVELGGAPATPLEVAADRLVVVAPALLAGPADLVVTGSGAAPLVVVGAVQVEPLSLTWAPGVPEAMEAPEAGEVRGAVVVDADRDGDLDLVLATDDGLRVLQNDGAARFALRRGPDGAPERPGGRADVRGLVAGDLDGDGTPEVVACTGAGRDVLLRATTAGLTPGPTLPWRAGGCRAISLAHVDRDGLPDIVTALPGPDGVGLQALIHDIEGTLWPDDRLAPPSDEQGPVGEATSADPSAVQTFDRVVGEASQGVGAGRLVATLTEAGPAAVFTLPTSLPQVPDRLRLAVRGDGAPVTVRLRVTDADGVTFDSPPFAVTAAWSEAVADGLPTWGGESTPAPPLASVAVVVSTEAPPATTTLDIDLVLAERDGFVPWLIDDFERRAPRWVWQDVAAVVGGDLDGDGLDDLLVLPGAGAPAPTLLHSRGSATPDPDGPPYLPTPVAVGGEGPFTAGLMLHADGDGALDALIVSGGAQDRLLVGDGWGQLVDATAGALPVDWSAGRAVSMADVDRDGHPDLVIGNGGQTDRLYRGLGDGRFVDGTVAFGFDDADTVAVLVADLDGDGDDDTVSVARGGSTAPLVRIAVGEDE